MSSNPVVQHCIEQRGVSAAFLQELSSSRLTEAMAREATAEAVAYLSAEVTALTTRMQFSMQASRAVGCRLRHCQADLSNREAHPYLTARDVHRLVVVARTKDLMCRYVELADVHGGRDAEGRAWVGEAQYFLSYSWDSPWNSIVDALNAHSEKQVVAGLPPPYYWIDIFAVNQHLSLIRPCRSGITNCEGCAAVRADMHAWDMADPNNPRGFERVIQHTKHVLVFNEPWYNPRPPTRVWCLFESYNVLTQDGVLEVVLDNAAQHDLQLSLGRQFGQLESIVDGIDARFADATEPTDRGHIFSAIENLPGGFDGLNSRLRVAQQQWLCETAELVIERTNPWRNPLDDIGMGLEIAATGNSWTRADSQTRFGAKTTRLLEHWSRLPRLLMLPAPLSLPLGVVGLLSVGWVIICILLEPDASKIIRIAGHRMTGHALDYCDFQIELSNYAMQQALRVDDWIDEELEVKCPSSVSVEKLPRFGRTCAGAREEFKMLPQRQKELLWNEIKWRSGPDRARLSDRFIDIIQCARCERYIDEPANLYIYHDTCYADWDQLQCATMDGQWCGSTERKSVEQDSMSDGLSTLLRWSVTSVPPIAAVVACEPVVERCERIGCSNGCAARLDPLDLDPDRDLPVPSHWRVLFVDDLLLGCALLSTSAIIAVAVPFGKALSVHQVTRQLRQPPLLGSWITQNGVHATSAMFAIAISTVVSAIMFLETSLSWTSRSVNMGSFGIFIDVLTPANPHVILAYAFSVPLLYNTDRLESQEAVYLPVCVAAGVLVLAFGALVFRLKFDMPMKDDYSEFCDHSDRQSFDLFSEGNAHTITAVFCCVVPGCFCDSMAHATRHSSGVVRWFGLGTVNMMLACWMHNFEWALAFANGACAGIIAWLVAYLVVSPQLYATYEAAANRGSLRAKAGMLRLRLGDVTGAEEQLNQAQAELLAVITPVSPSEGRTSHFTAANTGVAATAVCGSEEGRVEPLLSCMGLFEQAQGMSNIERALRELRDALGAVRQDE